MKVNSLLRVPVFALFVLMLTGFTTNPGIEKVWKLKGIYGDVHTYTALEELEVSVDVFSFNSDGTITAKRDNMHCGNDTNSYPLYEILTIGKWNWVKDNTIQLRIERMGRLEIKKYKVSKLTDTELTLIELKI